MAKLKQKTEAKLSEVNTLNELDVILGDDILAADALRAVPVSTHEWKPNTRAFVAELTGDERDKFETEWVDYKSALGEEEDNVGFRAFAVAWMLCDAQRVRLFGSDTVVSAAQTIGAKKNGKATARLFNVCSRINGLTKADIDALEKN